MPEVSLWWIVVAFASGGLAGAVFTAIVATIRNRIQPVDYVMNVSPLLASPLGSLQISVVLDGKPYTFSNAWTVEIELQNSGNQNLEHFEFGVDFPSSFHVLAMSTETGDRHHTAIATPEPSIERMRSGAAANVDVVLSPFNRSDRYKVRFSITQSVPASGGITARDVRVSTSKPVRLRRVYLAPSYLMPLRPNSGKWASNARGVD
jgi:hypothetical protein